MNARGRLKVPVMPSPPEISPGGAPGPWHRLILPVALAAGLTVLTGAWASTADKLSQVTRNTEKLNGIEGRTGHLEADMAEIRANLSAIRQYEADSNDRLKRLEARQDR